MLGNTLFNTEYSVRGKRRKKKEKTHTNFGEVNIHNIKPEKEMGRD